MRLIFLSHPEVVIDPAVPVPDWSLSGKGRARLERAAAAGWPSVERIVSSSERKAREAADILGIARKIQPDVHPGLAEIDRSATGFVSHERHEALAQRLFDEPDQSADGWETARHAQDRAIGALREVLSTPADVLIVGHGGTGTLIWCHLAGSKIDRAHDQKAMGSVWTACGPQFTPESGWQSLESVL